MMRPCVLLAVFAATAALPLPKIKEGGVRTATAIKKEVDIAVGLVERLHGKAEKLMDESGRAKAWPAPHKEMFAEVDTQMRSKEGSGGVYSAYYADSVGSFQGVLVMNNAYHVWRGVAPSSPELTCADPKKRDTCKSPDGTTPGYVETHQLYAENDRFEPVEMIQNATYDPRASQRYHDAKKVTVTSPYLWKADGFSSSICVTVLKGVFKDGKQMGVVGVDVDLNMLDMILGPMRPAPGSEVVLADVNDGSVIASTLPASRLVRMTHKKVSCFDPPFIQVFGPLAHTLGGLHRAVRMGPIILTNQAVAGNVLNWNAVYSHPITLSEESGSWLLVVTDDSEIRQGDAGASLTVNVLAVLCLVVAGLAASA